MKTWGSIHSRIETKMSQSYRPAAVTHAWRALANPTVPQPGDGGTQEQVSSTTSQVDCAHTLGAFPRYCSTVIVTRPSFRQAIASCIAFMSMKATLKNAWGPPLEGIHDATKMLFPLVKEHGPILAVPGLQKPAGDSVGCGVGGIMRERPQHMKDPLRVLRQGLTTQGGPLLVHERRALRRPERRGRHRFVCLSDTWSTPWPSLLATSEITRTRKRKNEICAFMLSKLG